MGLTDPGTVLLVDRVLSAAMMERAEANARGETDGPSITDMARRVLDALGAAVPFEEYERHVHQARVQAWLPLAPRCRAERDE